MSRIIIAGGREIKEYDIEWAVQKSGFNISTLLNGKCPYGGIDEIAENWANSKGIPIEFYPADFSKLGKKAVPLRNKKMINADAFGLILIWNGKSQGSKSMKEDAEKAGLFIYEIIFPTKIFPRKKKKKSVDDKELF